MSSKIHLASAAFLFCSLLVKGQAQGSPEELFKQVLTALEAKDQTALQQLTVTKAEFKKYLWPEIASRVSGSGMNADKYYALFEKSSQLGLSDRFADFGGRKWQFVKVSFAGDSKPSNRSRSLSSPAVTLRDESGLEKTVRLVAGVLVHDGVCKLTSFYVGPTQAAQK